MAKSVMMIDQILSIFVFKSNDFVHKEYLFIESFHVTITNVPRYRSKRNLPHMVSSCAYTSISWRTLNAFVFQTYSTILEIFMIFTLRSNHFVTKLKTTQFH